MAPKHGTHPRCQHCGGALYRSKEPGWRTRKTDPHVFCRNESCKSNKKKGKEEVAGQRLTRSKVRANRGVSPKRAPTVETREIEDTDEKETTTFDLSGVTAGITTAIDIAKDGKTKEEIALALAIAAKHVGEIEVAAVLAVKHGLSRFGFKVA